MCCRRRAAHFIGDDDEIALMRAEGFEIDSQVSGAGGADQRLAKRDRQIDREAAQIAAQDVSAAEGVKVLSARWFTTTTGKFLYVEAKSAAGEADTLTVTWNGGTMTLEPLVDPLPGPDGIVRHYLYHEGQEQIGDAPARVTVSSAQTASRSAPTSPSGFRR